MQAVKTNVVAQPSNHKYKYIPITFYQEYNRETLILLVVHLNKNC